MGAVLLAAAAAVAEDGVAVYDGAKVDELDGRTVVVLPPPQVPYCD